jgi:hypothetical protein
LGLKVILIDAKEDLGLQKSVESQNMRDEHMFKTLTSKLDENSKVLIFIGNSHVHKRPFLDYSVGFVKRLGARLTEQYGDAVKSIRYVGPMDRFDGLLPFESRTPTLQDIFGKGKEVVIIPDQGPVKGDEKVSAADFIITII